MKKMDYNVLLYLRNLIVFTVPKPLIQTYKLSQKPIFLLCMGKKKGKRLIISMSTADMKMVSEY